MLPADPASLPCSRLPALLAAPLLLLLLLAAAGGVRAEWNDCSSGATIFNVSDVTLDPSPVRPGDVARFLIKVPGTSGSAMRAAA